MPILTLQERIGTAIGGRYRIERLLARGGMSVLFEARDLRTHRSVAVKLLKTEDCVDERRIGRFLQEMRLTAELRDPHVVDVLDLGQDESGVPYLVMELLRGRTLQAELDARGKLNVEETLALLLPVMSALAGVHSAGVVHRDVKPDNIFLHVDGTGRVLPKLLDFGIAKQAFSTFGTRTGAVLGTPDYMAPEQALGDETSPATDVWGMGAVLYRTLYGETPFRSPSTAQTLAKLARETAPLLRVAGVPTALCAAIDRALAREVSGRYSCMGEFADAIVTCAREAGLAVPERVEAQAQGAEREFSDRRTRGTEPTRNTGAKPASRFGLRNALFAFGLIAIAVMGSAASRNNVANASRERTRERGLGPTAEVKLVSLRAPDVTYDYQSSNGAAQSEPIPAPEPPRELVDGGESEAAASAPAAPLERQTHVRRSNLPRGAAGRARTRRTPAQTAKPMHLGDLPVAVEW